MERNTKTLTIVCICILVIIQVQTGLVLKVIASIISIFFMTTILCITTAFAISIIATCLFVTAFIWYIIKNFFYELIQNKEDEYN